MGNQRGHGGKRQGAGRPRQLPKSVPTETVKDIRAVARRYTEAAIVTLNEIMNDPDAPPMARITAANSLLDRGHGKPSSPDHAIGATTAITELLRQVDGMTKGVPYKVVDVTPHKNDLGDQGVPQTIDVVLEEGEEA